MKKAAWTFLCSVALATLACESTNDVTGPDAVSPVGTWQLQSIETAAGVTVVPEPERYTLELRDDERAHVVADCNVCNGGYQLNGASLSFGLMACTLAACPPDSLHDDYVRAIGSVTSWQRSGNDLLLSFDGGTLRFRAP